MSIKIWKLVKGSPITVRQEVNLAGKEVRDRCVAGSLNGARCHV